MPKKKGNLIHSISPLLVLSLIFSPVLALADEPLAKSSEKNMPVSYSTQEMLGRQASLNDQMAGKNELSLLVFSLNAPGQIVKAVLEQLAPAPGVSALPPPRLVLADGTVQYFDPQGRMTMQVGVDASKTTLRFLYNPAGEMTYIYVSFQVSDGLKQISYDLKTKEARENYTDGSVYTYTFDIASLVTTPNVFVALNAQVKSQKVLTQKKLSDGTTQYFSILGKLIRQDNNDAAKTILQFGYNGAGEIAYIYQFFGTMIDGSPKQIVYSLATKEIREYFSNGNVYNYNFDLTQPLVDKDGRVGLNFQSTTQKFLSQRRLDNGATQFFNAAGILTRYDLNDPAKTVFYFVYSPMGQMTHIHVSHYAARPDGLTYTLYDLAKKTAQAQYSIGGVRSTKTYSFSELSAGGGNIVLGPNQIENVRWTGKNLSDNRIYALVTLDETPGVPPVLALDPDRKTLINQKTVTVTYTADGVIKQKTFLDLNEGVNALSLSEKNTKGLETILNFNVTVDTIIPAIVLDSKTETLINVKTLTVSYKVDGVVKQMTFEDLQEGMNSLTITEMDLAGNRSEFNFIVTVEIKTEPLSNWFDEHMNDSVLRDLGHDLFIDGLLDRNDMLDLFDELVLSGSLEAAEFSDLQLIANTSTLFGDLIYVWELTKNVVLGSVANTYYQGGALGNLALNSTAAHLGKLVSKWFLGADRPQSPGTYMEIAGSLFVNGISHEDIRQGGVGDCYLLAGLAEVAYRDPGVITDMFIDNGDGTFTVHFYHNGKTQFFTVDRYLPTITNPAGQSVLAFAGSGSLSSNTNNELWVALAEKAYVQASELRWDIGLNKQLNAYFSIGGGYIQAALSRITGESTVGFLYLQKSNFAAIKTTFDNGYMMGFASKGAPPLAVANHAYAMVGYDSVTQTIKLFNPWGAHLPNHGVLTLTWSQLLENFSYFERTTGLPQAIV